MSAPEHRQRGSIAARRGMVATPHHLATLAGFDMLRRGGNAVDAAIAAQAALAVVYPHMTGIGGDAFWLVHDAATGRVHALNGSGRAARAATPERLREAGHESIPVRGPLSAITVPGAVDSWCSAHERFGRLGFAELITPAVDFAREGHPVTESQAATTAQLADVLQAHPDTRRTLSAPTSPGAVQRVPELADTLEAIAEGGRDAFYTDTAARIVKALAQAGGLLDAEDFAEHRSEWTEPISTTYRGHTCYQHPPNSQGLAHLMVLNILERHDLASLDRTQFLHLVVEATKLAFAARDRHIADPDFAHIPLTTLLDKEHAAELAERIDPGHAATPGPPRPAGGDTTATTVADTEGNAVCVIQSIYHEFGSGVVAGDTGVLLQNRGAFFSLAPEHPNRLEPGKRTFHTLMPGMMHNDHGPVLVYGTMGGEGQPQTQTALVTGIVDFGRGVQAAVDAPRWLYGRTWGAPSTDLHLEARMGEEVAERLRGMGHPVRMLGDYDSTLGHAQAVQMTSPGGPLRGAADPRGDGVALGW